MPGLGCWNSFQVGPDFASLCVPGWTMFRAWRRRWRMICSMTGRLGALIALARGLIGYLLGWLLVLFFLPAGCLLAVWWLASAVRWLCVSWLAACCFSSLLGFVGRLFVACYLLLVTAIGCRLFVGLLYYLLGGMFGCARRNAEDASCSLCCHLLQCCHYISRRKVGKDFLLCFNPFANHFCPEPDRTELARRILERLFVRIDPCLLNVSASKTENFIMPSHMHLLKLQSGW